MSVAARRAALSLVALFTAACGARSSLSLQEAGDGGAVVPSPGPGPGPTSCGSLDDGCRRFGCGSWRDFDHPPCGESLGDPIFETTCAGRRALTFRAGSATTTYVYDAGGSLVGVRSSGVIGIDGTTGTVCYGVASDECAISTTNLCAGVGPP